MHFSFYQLLDIIGTMAFAISGIRMASAKQFDWFGAYVVGLTTAIGGGTLRDLLLGLRPFWMTNAIYLIISAIALLWVVIFRKQLVRQSSTWFIFDAVGLALFTVTGIEKTIGLNYPFWVAIIMGSMTGAAGGVLRDVLINDVPLIFRKEIYAMACVVGGLVFWLCDMAGVDTKISAIACGITVFACRMLAVKYHISLPVLKGENTESE